MREQTNGFGERDVNVPRLAKAGRFLWNLWKRNRAVERIGVMCPRDEVYHEDHKVLALKTDSYWPWYERGEALRRRGRYWEALASFDRALELNPDCVWSWHARGQALAELGCYFEAVASYMTALKLEPTNLFIRYDQAAALANLKRQRQTARGGRPPLVELRPRLVNPKPGLLGNAIGPRSEKAA